MSLLQVKTSRLFSLSSLVLAGQALQSNSLLHMLSTIPVVSRVELICRNTCLSRLLHVARYVLGGVMPAYVKIKKNQDIQRQVGATMV